MAKNLVIVESPAKARTIEGFLGKDFMVKSSFGHVRDLSKKKLGVDIDNDFLPDYEISADKKKIVSDLKKSAAEAEIVWLATDEDREGEAISWHLSETLGLKDSNTKRIVFHEITKTAILEAINNPRSIDRNLVYAQQARRVLDRLVGFELSPLLWKKVRPALSAGRVQSVAVRLICEKEDEIRAFVSTSSFRITGDFLVQGPDGPAVIKAELNKRFEKEEQAKDFLERCKGAAYVINDVETKPSKKSPAPPFTTSTLQQEAARKLGFSVSKTMLVAQQLYESGKITYMRTDSVNLSNMALGMAKTEVTKLFGPDFVKTRQFTTKTKGAQEAHEAIRPTYLDHAEIAGDASQQRLYELIWKRTIASQMADAILEKTNVTIDINKAPEKFIARGEVIKFDGFLRVYMESSDDENEEGGQESIIPPVKAGDPLKADEIKATQRFAQFPLRYTEASLVKKLEELGIGRPSTYAPTISTIQKREYVTKGNVEGTIETSAILTLKTDKITLTHKKEKVGFDKGKILPTDLGSLVNKFLIQYFDNIIDYNFTAKVEEEFDKIAAGERAWNEIIREFYQPFHQQIDETQQTTSKFSGQRLLGVDPKSEKNVFVKIGRYGPMVQIGDTESEEKPRFARIGKGQSIETITLDEALELFKLPRVVGTYEDQEVVIGTGRFGPFVKLGNGFYSLGKDDEPFSVTLDRAIEIILEKKDAEEKKLISVFEEEPELRVLNGRYGPYISFKKRNFKIPRNKDPKSLSLAECLQIIEEAGDEKPKAFVPRKKSK
ncbi:MAG: type I DNA topoisomerase [Bacteroidota bacterium]